MKDPYPEFIGIEIDRGGLRQYLRVTGFLGWVLSFSVFGFMVGVITVLEELENGGFESVGRLLYGFLCRASGGAAIAAPFGFILYLMLGHFRAKRAADALQFRVAEAIPGDPAALSGM